MGGRLLRRWINDPLIDIEEIQDRLNAVQELKLDMMLKDDVQEGLKKIFDIERIARKNLIWECKRKRHAFTKIINTENYQNSENCWEIQVRTC